MNNRDKTFLQKLDKKAKTAAKNNKYKYLTQFFKL